jgi:V8-like Glu-specific endopeptidase
MQVHDPLEFPNDIIHAAAQRWHCRESERSRQTDAIRSGRITEAESPERIQRRLSRLSSVAARPQTPLPSGAVPRLVETIGLERVLGKSDFLGMQFMELALAVSRFTGRVHIRQRPGRTAGFGTGFMVSPRLMLTNNHVLPSADFAAHSEIEFDFQHDRLGRPLPVVVYPLEPQVFFLTNKELDYTLVAVRQVSTSGTDLKLYGWNRLDPEQGKALLGDSLNIIQHPKGEPKQIVLRSNQLVDLMETFAHYVTDTEPGSSGAAVYNDQWEVVALHHAGVPKMDAQGNLMATDGSIWTEDRDSEELDWVANEGIRVSTLVGHIKQQPAPNDTARQLMREMLERQPPDPLEAAAMAADTTPKLPAISTSVPRVQGRTLDVTIPIHISVRIGDPASDAARVPSGPALGFVVPPPTRH